MNKVWILLLFLLAACTTSPQAGISLGSLAPGFSVNTNRGSFVLKRSTKPVVLEIFATWCGHCKNEVRTMNALYQQYDGNMRFVSVTGSRFGIDGTSTETASDVASFTRAFHVAYPIALDASLSVAKSYHTTAFPHIIIIGADGRVAFQAFGEVPYTVLSDQLARLTCATGNACHERAGQ